MPNRLAPLAAFAAHSAAPGFAKAVPGLRGVDHIGIAVPDLAQARTRCAGGTECQTAVTFGLVRDDRGNVMQAVPTDDPNAVFHRITRMHCGFGSYIALFRYCAPDQQTVAARNSDISGHRIALHVDDIAACRKTSGVTGTIGRVPLSEGAAGPSILHFAPRRGLPSEGVNHPPGMAYETDGGPAPWSDTDPAR